MASILALDCGSSTSRPQVSSDAGADAGDDTGAVQLLATRPYDVYAPSGYDPRVPTPLLVMLHGYSGSGPSQESYYFDLIPLSESNGFLYAFPNGTIDAIGNRFWNATDACCDFYHTGVDDVAYLAALLDDMSAAYNVDPKRVFAIGASNGGYMVHRLGCDLAARFAAIVSVSGAQWNDPTRCPAADRVSVVEIHGDQDPTVAYDGGTSYGVAYPGAATTVATWAAKDGCTGALTDTGATLDLASEIAGAETQVAAYGGCPPGIDVQLWTIRGGGHVPLLNTTTFGQTVWAFMTAHAKPSGGPAAPVDGGTVPKSAMTGLMTRGRTDAAPATAPANATIDTFSAETGSGLAHQAPFAYADTGLTVPMVAADAGPLVAVVDTGPPSTLYPWAEFGVLFNQVYDLDGYAAVTFNVSGSLNAGCTIAFSLLDQTHSFSPPFGTCVGAASCYPGLAVFALPATATDVTLELADIRPGAPPTPILTPAQAIGVEWLLQPATGLTGDAGAGCAGSVTVNSLAFVARPAG